MGVCCLNRKEPIKLDTNNTNTTNKDNVIALLGEDYGTEAITEDYLKKMYSNANREENLEILLSLTDNQSAITIDETLLRSNWLTKPDTLGDVAIIQILNIIQKKIKGFLLDEREMYISKNKDQLQQKIDNFMAQLEKINLINKMVQLLDSNSYTKKDVAILILCTLSACRCILSLMMNREFIKNLTLHVNRFKTAKYKNYKEHIIATLQLFRRIYIKELQMRQAFLEAGGIEIINEFLKTEDVDIVQEVLYNIEDLIYNDDEEYQSISKLVIMEMVENLVKCDIEKMLYDLYQQTQKHRHKYSVIEIDLKRLISIFGGKDSIKQNKFAG